MAFALRLAILYFLWHWTPARFHPNEPYGRELGRVAESIASGRGFSSPLRLVTTGPTAWFGPIYPYLAAGIFRVGGIYTPAAHVILQTLNCLFAALVIFPIYAAAKRTFGVEVAVLASWLWVVLPNACHIPIVYVWDTTLSALWFALIFQATLALRGSNRLTSWMGYGALWGIGGLTNPSLLSTLPFLLAWLVWGVKKQLLPWLRPVAAALFVFALCLAPWTVRNYRLFGKVIPVRSNFGLELWLGNNPRGSKVKEFALHPFWNAAEAERYKRLGEIAYMEEKQHAALAFMKTHPAQTLGFIFRRFAENWFVPRDRPVSAWSGASLAIKAFLVGQVNKSCAECPFVIR